MKTNVSYNPSNLYHLFKKALEWCVSRKEQDGCLTLTVHLFHASSFKWSPDCSFTYVSSYVSVGQFVIFVVRMSIFCVISFFGMYNILTTPRMLAPFVTCLYTLLPMSVVLDGLSDKRLSKQKSVFVHFYVITLKNRIKIMYFCFTVRSIWTEIRIFIIFQGRECQNIHFLLFSARLCISKNCQPLTPTSNQNNCFFSTLNL